MSCIRPNKKIPVLRVTRPYLNLLVKPRIFSGFLENIKIYAFCKAKCLSKCIKLFFLSRKKSGRVLELRPRGRGFEPHQRHCIVVLEQDTFILA